MKNKTQIWFLMLFAFTLTYIQGQDIKNEDDALVINQEKFITLSQLNGISPQERETAISEVGTSSIFIQQIGVNNNILSDINAQASDITLIQKGDNNTIELKEASREVEKMITQEGNNNSVIDFSFNPDISTSLDLIQQGDNLSFERFGSNELSKNLKFKMSGNARTIIIRSF
ncbi:hypothetical protein [Aquimarina sp. 2201CG5-10]|uniref:hypothetical protein n=1 Tax=Aquimarina callyspongiae TaxID=3098150 RepID=UPI002AB4184F|nr:hypothetical protein [Aquimarina sp. 2201CG5-10]MDY8134292.1 hypothetical protein [Aquimarina sp. 2201CG5-10]